MLKKKKNKDTHKRILKTYAKAKKNARDKGGHFILIKKSIHREGVTVLHIYGSSNRVFKIHETKIDGTVRRNP